MLKLSFGSVSYDIGKLQHTIEHNCVSITVSESPSNPTPRSRVDIGTLYPSILYSANPLRTFNSGQLVTSLAIGLC